MRSLGLGRGAVDLVGEDDVGEDGTGQELEGLAAGVLVVEDDLGAGDVAGHQVGRELDAFEGKLQGLGERRNEESLGEAGDAHEQGVVSGEDGDEDFIDHVGLPDDDLGDLLEERGVSVAHELDRLVVVGSGGKSGGERFLTHAGNGSGA